MIAFIKKWYQRRRYGYSDHDVATVQSKLIAARDEKRPFRMSEYEERALTVAVNQGGTYTDGDE